MSKLSNLDLRLLQVFDEIEKSNSLSRTAEKMQLTQPAISLALAKLRDHFGDPLFVRTSTGMLPTPLATELTPLVRSSITNLQSIIDLKIEFAPQNSEKLFRICITDIGQIVLLPNLLKTLGRIAPRVQLEVTNISSTTARNLELGEIDLAVGFMPDIEPYFFQQVVLEEQFICLARRGHPRIKKTLTMDNFQNERHVVISTSGTGHLVVDKAIVAQGLRRKVGVRIPNFIGLAIVIEATDFICTLPRRAGLVMARSGDINVFDPPLSIPTYKVRQHWHERRNKDPSLAWLRSVIAGLYQTTKIGKLRGTGIN
jgi:DNA-binding transcriptional LysR family regulator